MRYGPLSTVAVFLTLASAFAKPPVSQRPSQLGKPVDIVFDMDDTLIRWVRPDESLSGKILPPQGKILGYRYRVLDGAADLLQSLSEIPGVRISFFSLGPKARNRKILKELKLPDGRSAWDIAYRVLGREDTTTTDPVLSAQPIEKEPSSKLLKKNLRKINSDLNRVILVDDQPRSPLSDQEGNVFWIGPKSKHFPATASEMSSTRDFVIYRNRLAFARGILGRVLDRVDRTGISPKQALAEVAPDRLRDDVRVYREGALEFHRIDPSYRFTPASTGADSVTKCLWRLFR